MSNQNKKVKIFDGRFEVLSIIGRGESSVVYKARHITAPYTEVALKVLVDKNSQDATLEKLRREALAMVSCRHKYVIRLDDFRSFNDLSYICMEYAPKGDLRVYTSKKGGRLPVEQATVFLKQILEALSYIHESGIIHRDIKPDNILVMNDNQICLGDFGLTLLPTEEASADDLKNGIGTSDYLAPEVIQGQTYNASSDIYALGLTFYELISGISPFSNVPVAHLLNARSDDNIKQLNEVTNDIPDYLADIIKKAMAFNINNRYVNASEMLTDLQAKKVNSSSSIQDDSVNEIPDDFDKTTPGSPIILTQSLIDNSSQSDQNDSFVNDEKNSNDYDENIYFQSDSAPSGNIEENRYETNRYEQHSSNVLDENSTLMEDEYSESDSIQSYIDSLTEKENATPPKNNPNADYSHDTVCASSVLLSKKDLNKNVQQTFDETVSDANSIPSSNMFDFYTGRNNSSVNKSFNNLSSHSQIFKSKSDIIKKYLPFGLIVLAILFLIFLFYILFGNNSQETTVRYEYKKLPLISSDSNYVFPHLPSGTYFGEINGLFPNVSLPLTIISDDKDGRITVLIGLDGWKPVTTTLPPNNHNLSIKGNGFVLSFNSESDSTEDIISGHFKNIVSLESGKWQVRALK